MSRQVISPARSQGFKPRNGLAATLRAFKPDAHDVCTTLSREAEVAGVVNTLVFHDTGAIEGHNTDGPGLVVDMTTHQGWNLDRARVLILGAGGATQGVLGALLETNPASIHVWNRTHTRAEQLVHQPVSYTHLPAHETLFSIS